MVLTDTFRIIGFGAEVITSFPGADKVYVAENAEGTEYREGSFSEFGTRHRSAFRFVGSMESATAFVMSAGRRDQGMLAWPGPRLLMWNFFKIGFVTALT